MHEIEIICHRAFKIIKSCPLNLLNPRFKEFPRGCCGIGTEIIGTYLQKNGFGVFNYVNAQNESGISHAWAQKGNLIVDLTITQFSNDLAKFMVVNETESTWHKQFSKSGIVRPINLYETPDFQVNKILPFYEYVSHQLNLV